YAALVLRKAFTVNVAPEWLVEQSDYFGTASGRKTDKFADTGLTPVKSKLVDAPYIKEFPLILECRLSHTVEIGLHTQFVGEILDVKVDEEMLGENGLPDILKVKPLIYAPSGGYFGIGEDVGAAYQVGKKFAKEGSSDED
ncbi:MAG TPA: flavin reductase family protein, partial [candidate division Zixibacteria bacterium]|nr:flavin reductase family protein [candidate division Zixibacteria bacterium]